MAAEEALRDDGLRFAQKARAAGVHVETTVWPVVPHAWQLLAKVPEAKRSIARAAEFLKAAMPEDIEILDAVIVGAGLSGIGAAVHLQRDFPGRRFTILESRAAMGGTWDLFRYPGVRSDSDMFTLGYAFKPWTDAKSLADGPAIRNYIVETAVEHGLDHQVRYGHKVVRADWSSADARWTLEIEHAPDAAASCGTRAWPAASCWPAAATTATPKATRPSSRARPTSPAAWCIRSSGPRISTTPASAWW